MDKGIEANKGLLQACWCCGESEPIRGEGDPFEGRLDGYCTDCSWARCDAYPGECPRKAIDPLEVARFALARSLTDEEDKPHE